VILAPKDTTLNFTHSSAQTEVLEPKPGNFINFKKIWNINAITGKSVARLLQNFHGLCCFMLD